MITKIYLFAVIEEKREPIFQEALKDLGPPDGSILLQFEDAIGKKLTSIFTIFLFKLNIFLFFLYTGADLNEIVDEHFLESLKSTLTEAFGELRFVKFINEMLWVAFHNYKVAIGKRTMP